MQTADDYVEQVQTEITNEINVIAIVLLVFAAIALFVSVLVIANTFSILFAQRSRDFALLRCVGATRRQVLRSIRARGAVPRRGRLAARPGSSAPVSATGWSPWPAALMPPATMGDVDPSLPPGTPRRSRSGLLVTLVAAWLPTRRTVRVSPLAALRPDAGVDARTTAGRLRTGPAWLLVAGGAVLLGRGDRRRTRWR